MSRGIQRPRVPPVASAAKVTRPQLPSQRAALQRRQRSRPMGAVYDGNPAGGLRPQREMFTPGSVPLTYDAQGIAHPANGRSFLRIPEAGTTGQGGNTAAGLPQGTQSNAAGPITADNPATPAPGMTDSTFTQQVGGLFKTVADQRAGIEAQGRIDAADFQQANAMRARQAALASENADYAMNRTGNFYSGQLGKAQGQVRTSAMEAQAAAQNAYNRALAARQQQLDQVGTLAEDPSSPTGYSATGGAANALWGYFDSAYRRRTDANQDVAPPADAPTAPAAAVTAQQAAISGMRGVRKLPDGRIITARSGKEMRTFAGMDSKGRKGIWRYYPDGKSTFTRTG